MLTLEAGLAAQQLATEGLGKKVDSMETTMEKGFAAMLAKMDQMGSGGGGRRGGGGGGSRGGSGRNEDGTIKDDSKVKC